MIITGLRMQALRMVNSTDYTYSKGYLGLLSVLGALLSVITCSAPSLVPLVREVSRLWRRPISNLTFRRWNQTTAERRSTNTMLCQWTNRLLSIPERAHITKPQETHQTTLGFEFTQATTFQDLEQAHLKIQPSNSASSQ